MSFGFGVGDLISIGTLAWDLYRSCKGLSEEFQELSREALTIHTVVKELQDEADDERSLLRRQGTSKQRELKLLIEGLDSALLEADAIVRKYQSLGRAERRIRDQLRFATKDLAPIRGKLNLHLNAINAFMASMSHNSLARIERTLRQMVSRTRSSRRPASILSTDEEEESSVWKELESELTEDGVTRESIAEHKMAIRIFVHNLLSGSAAESMSLHDVATLVEPHDGAEKAISSSALGKAASWPQDSTHSQNFTVTLQLQVVYLLIVGPTGAGKSTFISAATGSNELPLESAGKTATEIRDCIVNHVLGNIKYEIHLIECPSFNDAYMTDISKISDFDNSESKPNRTLAGVLYVHNISEQRMNRRHFHTLKSIIGNDSRHKCTFVTTKWGCSETPDEEFRRERTLREMTRFYGTRTLMRRGWAQTERFSPMTKDRALEIIEPLLGNDIAINNSTLEHSMDDSNLTSYDQDVPGPDHKTKNLTL